MFNSSPVPLLDDFGQPVTGASGQLAMFPKLADPHFFVDRGEAVYLQQVNPHAFVHSLARMMLDLPKFWQFGPWELQRNPDNTQSLIDGATIAIGLYGAAARIPEDVLLEMKNRYTEFKSNFNSDTYDYDCIYLQKRNVMNTHIGYELYQSGKIRHRRITRR